MKRICSVEGCQSQHNAHGLCSKHTWRIKRYGTTGLPRRATVDERFWSYVDKSARCWHWTGHKDHCGYGRFQVGSRSWPAHRWAYQHIHGDIPAGMQVDHICHTHDCVNPAHLRPATFKQQQENAAGAYQNSRSGVRGVTWVARRKRWLVTVGHNNKKHHVGYYKSIEEAERAAIEKRCELFTHNVVDRREVIR